MRKVNPSPAGSQGELSTPHSPLSPLTPTSPSYPDGLIAPIWVHKHSDRVPSVFVLFLRLYESPDEEAVEDILGGNEAQESAKRAKEQEMDESLVKEIGDRRRRLGERGIKLTVVLMASAAALGRSSSSMKDVGFSLISRLPSTGPKTFIPPPSVRLIFQSFTIRPIPSTR